MAAPTGIWRNTGASELSSIVKCRDRKIVCSRRTFRKKKVQAARINRATFEWWIDEMAYQNGAE
jgi:hypothetical protein